MIKIENLQFAYNSKTKLYNDVSMTFEKGKIYGLLGKNGSGKSTLLNILATYLPGYKGNVSIDGIEARLRKREYLQKIFYVPEIVNESILTIKDLIIMGRAYEKWDEAKFAGFLERDNIQLKKKMKELSKGWRKRVYFYYALSINPEILILDEVSEGVDLIAQKEIIKDLMEYFDEDKTVIISTHHIEEFENIIEDIIVVDSGIIHYNGDKNIIDKCIGWTTGENKGKVISSDIVMSKKILEQEYLLIKNREKYSGLEFKTADMATFIAAITSGKEII